MFECLRTISNAILFQQFLWPDLKTLLFLLLNGFLGSMVSDVLWALAVIMTSPFAASVGLALTIPMGWIADFVFHKNCAFIFGQLIPQSCVTL
jgi:solute carrier family 35 protein F5